MSEENVEVLKAMFRGWEERGTDGLVEVFDEHSEYLPREEAGTVRGRDGLRRYLQRWLDAWEGEFRIEGTEFLDAGDYVLVREVLKGRGKHSGVETATVFWSVSLLRDGKIVHRDEYLERDEALKAAGLSE